MKKVLLCLSLLACLSAPIALFAGEGGLRNALHLYYRGDYQEAVEAFKEVIAEDPENASAYYYLGYTYQEMGNYIAARMAFKKTYEINPDFVPDVGGKEGPSQ